MLTRSSRVRRPFALNNFSCALPRGDGYQLTSYLASVRTVNLVGRPSLTNFMTFAPFIRGHGRSSPRARPYNAVPKVPPPSDPTPPIPAGTRRAVTAWPAAGKFNIPDPASDGGLAVPMDPGRYTEKQTMGGSAGRLMRCV